MEFVELIKTPKVDGVILRLPFQEPVEGTLCLTGHHLILSSRKSNSEELWLLHSNIDCLEKKFVGSTGYLTLKCKDFKTVHLDIPGMEECLNIASSIEVLSSLESVSLTYPFFFRPMFDIMEDGWQAFLPENEFARLLGEEWRLSHVNKTFEVCYSYPQTVIVPKSIDDATLMKSAAFRHGGRFPVLSYHHSPNGMVIMRCGQPLTGPNNKRCKDDERLVNAVLGIGKRGYIIDTRSSAGAQTARAKGGGVEPEAHYPQWRKIHKSIDRFYVLQESLVKLIDACTDTNSSMDKWISRLDSCNWLSHIKDVLTTACLAAQCIDREGASVLVHGSEGIDSTLQVTSLAQIILDPDCRTVRGFEALVEREWLQSGHPFADRCSKSAYSTSKPRYEGPVFLHFLDCVWQIYQQFPCSFEFNEHFLIYLFEHAYGSQFGTFMCNNEADRKKVKLSTKTVSLWSYVNRPEILQTFLNPLYEKNDSVIWPSVAPQSLMLWSGLYMRYELNQSANDDAWKEIVQIKQHDKELKLKAVKLRKQLSELQKEAVEKNIIVQ
ncbi:myotubularin-related protein 9-like [Glandiceps talaboti]